LRWRGGQFRERELSEKNAKKISSLFLNDASGERTGRRGQIAGKSFPLLLGKGGEGRFGKSLLGFIALTERSR